MGGGLVDRLGHRPVRYSPLLLGRCGAALLGLTPTAFSELASPRQVLRTLRPALAAQVGIAADTPLILGGGDGPLASIGVGSYESGTLAINVGTSAAARLLIREPTVDPGGSLWTYVADERLWVIGGIVSSGGIVYEWALRNFLAGVQDAEVSGVAARAEAERLAACVPPGAEHLLFVPYLGGEQCPAWNPHTRGSFFGLDFHHDRGHFLARHVRRHHPLYLPDRRTDPAALDVGFDQIGPRAGYRHHPSGCQIPADMFGVPIAVPNGRKLCARGRRGRIDGAGLQAESHRVSRAVETQQLVCRRQRRMNFMSSSMRISPGAGICPPAICQSMKRRRP